MPESRFHRAFRHGTTAALVAVAAVLLWAFWPEHTITVRTTEVRRGTVEQLVSSVQAGEVKPRRRASIRATTIGRVQRIYVVKGERVEEGKLLLELENSSLQARLRLARANLQAGESALRSARLRLRTAGQSLERTKALSEKGVVATQALERAQAEYEVAGEAVATAEANIVQLKAAVDVAVAALEESYVKAPFSGQVAELYVEQGETLLAGAPVMELVDSDSVSVVVPVDEADAAKLSPGMLARVLCDALAEKKIEGRLSWISPVVLKDMRQNRHLEIEVVFDGQPVELKPGMSADVEVVVRREENTLFVPSNAIVRKGGSEQVYLVRGSRARLHDIRSGISNWERTQVLEGLVEGDRIVLDLAKPDLRDGVRVRQHAEPPSPPAAKQERP